MHQHKDVTKPETEKECADVQQWYGTTFTNNKAGMAAVDKEKVKRVVYEMSKARAQDTSFHYLCTVVCASTPRRERTFLRHQLSRRSINLTCLCRILLTSSMASGCRDRPRRGSEG